MAAPRKPLGRGLAALLGAPPAALTEGAYFLCPLADLKADPRQPRHVFEAKALAELAASIKENGILQPLVVRKTPDAAPGIAPYTVVAGERRLRAARAAGLQDVPVLVKDVASEAAIELALVENLQRQDLNAIEEAEAYRSLLERPEMSQPTLARRLGKDRSTIANALRLLRLDPALQTRLAEGALTAGHARALLSIEDLGERARLGQRIEDDGLSVRATEQAARAIKAGATGTTKAPSGRAKANPLQPYCDGIADELAEALGVPVLIASHGRRGKIVIHFEGLDTLRAIRDHIARPGA